MTCKALRAIQCNTMKYKLIITRRKLILVQCTVGFYLAVSKYSAIKATNRLQ